MPSPDNRIGNLREWLSRRATSGSDATMRARSRRRCSLLVTMLLAAGGAPVTAQAQAPGLFPGQGLLALSQAAGGGAANGVSRNAAISQDKRFARLAAFESAATNIVPGSGAYPNVYVVRRTGPYGENGTPWVAGATVLASVGMNGQPANGPSGLPSLDGTSRVAPHCVAFVSAASNLVRGDTNGKPDAFVRDLVHNRTIRVSVSSSGGQSRGSVSEVAVNGLCTRAAFVSDGGDLALATTRRASWRSAVTGHSPAGRRQVYLHAFAGSTGLDRALKGLTFLASSNASRIPGNGDCFGIAYSVNSRALTFTSSASNLAGGDANGVPDVYQRLMVRTYGTAVHGRRPQLLRMTTQLVSRTATGSAGSGASGSPASNVDGSIVAYATLAPNLIGANPNAIAQVVQAQLTSGRVITRLVSHTAAGAPGNAPSGAPTTTAAGSWVIFQSAASDVGVDTARLPDRNGVQDIELFTASNSARLLMAGTQATSAAANPMTSPHGNYVVFERAGSVWLNYLGAK